jgi:hypothetical protein
MQIMRGTIQAHTVDVNQNDQAWNHKSRRLSMSRITVSDIKQTQQNLRTTRANQGAMGRCRASLAWRRSKRRPPELGDF